MTAGPIYTDLAVLIPAAGSGNRLGLGPKALLQLNEAPLVQWVARKALSVATEVVIACRPQDLATVSELCPGCRCVPGGDSRQQTVQQLFAASRAPWLLLHDVARPFVTATLLRQVFAAAQASGAAAALLDPEVPVGLIAEGRITRHFPREQIGIFQSPQVFSRQAMQAALAYARQNGLQTQSTLQLVLATGAIVQSVPGEKANIKITTPEDWLMAQCLTRYLT